MSKTNSSGKKISDNSWFLVTIVLLGLVMVFVVLMRYGSAKPTSKEDPFAQLTSDQVALVDEITYDIGPCPCGQCDLQLSNCDCDHPNGAETLKGAMAQGIKRGLTKDQILQDLQERYGVSVASPVAPSQ